MIELNEKQRLELDAEVPRVLDPQTQKTYVLVSEEVFSKIQELLIPDRIPIDEQKRLLFQAGKRAGWDDPEMDVYDREDD